MAYSVPPPLRLLGLDLQSTQQRLENCEDWHHMEDAGELGFGTGWSNTSGTVGGPDDCAYLKTTGGLTVVKGRVRKDVANAPGTLDRIFSLRDGYGTRGTRRYIVRGFTSASGEVFARVSVLGNDIYFFDTGGAAVTIDLDLDISFIAEN